MSQDPENFDSLRKLLTLKRHEQPPPGYFDQLASEVMARIKNGELSRPDLWNDLGEEASWLQRLLGMLNARPALAGAFGVMACGLVLAGVYLAQPNEPQAATTAQVERMNPPLVLAPAAVQPSAELVSSSSTNPVVNSLSGSSLFNQLGVGGQTVPVSLGVGGN